MDFSKSRKELAVKFSSDITVKVNEYMMEVDNELSKEGFNDQQIGLIVNNSAMGMIINIIGQILATNTQEGEELDEFDRLVGTMRKHIERSLDDLRKFRGEMKKDVH